jgi:hypothetical protein
MFVVPASPASPPAASMASTYVPPIAMPAYRDANGLAPTARRRNPTVDRSSSHHTTTAAASARNSPAWTVMSPKLTWGRRADSATALEIGSSRPGRWNASVRSA